MWRVYVIGAAALAFVGTWAGLLYYRGDAIAARADAARYAQERNTLIAVGEAKDREIARLVRQRNIDDNVLADIRKELQSISEAQTQASLALSELESANEGVRLFLDTALPDDLKRLLNVR